jgi:DNA-binding response OmpR family regulator
MRILLVDDYRSPIRELCENLAEENFAVDIASTVQSADAKARRGNCDVIVLNLSSTRIDGLSLLRCWRRDNLDTQVLALTAGDAETRARCLEHGADDCLSIPFVMGELLARLRALIRRLYRVKDPVIRVHDLEIHTPTRAVSRAGMLISLTRLEYAMLEYLAFRRGTVVTRAMIAEHLYPRQDRGTSNVVDVYIGYLRNKIDKGFDLPLVLTRWGQGYVLRGE